jgi:hypothetical protein
MKAPINAPPQGGNPDHADLICVRWDGLQHLAEITHPNGLALAETSDVLALKNEVVAKLSLLQTPERRLFPILVCIDGLSTHPGAVNDYSHAVTYYSKRFASAVARYGKPSTSGSLIAVGAMNEGYRANLFQTRHEAVAHLKKHG